MFLSRYFPVCLAILAVLFMAPEVLGQKLRLRSQIQPDCSTGGGNTTLKFADIYADGNIAVQGSYNCRGVFIYDLTNPDAPVLASVYDPSPNQSFLEAVVIGNRGYFGSGGPFAAGAPSSGDGVHIVDLTDPYRPVLLGKVNASTGNGFNGIHEMVVHENYLIENYNSTSNKTLKIIDISNPAGPVHKWDFSPVDALWVHAVHVRGNRMYTSGWNGRIEIYDISNLATSPPVLLGSVMGNSSNHSSWTSEDGNYLYSCRETFDGDLRVYDVRNPAQPLLVRSIKTSELGLNAISPHNPVVMGNLLYISWYQAGVQVFDLTDPTFPRRIAQYDTYESAMPIYENARSERVTESKKQTRWKINPKAPVLSEAEPWDMICGAPNLQNSLPTNYDGNWAVYPFLGQDKVLAGDMSKGLLILDASSIASPLKNRVSDFDGDGKTDLSVFRPSLGLWQVERSSDGQAVETLRGQPEDIITTGDYDGDGRSETAVYSPSEGRWYLASGIYEFGLPGDMPVPADYDADGRTDMAVFRTSDRTWRILQSTAGDKTIQWGMDGDIPVVGDFEGDGKPDFTVWRPSNGTWYVRQSSSSMTLTYRWGIEGDRPLSADFDGNGISDYAVFRPSVGAWFISDAKSGKSRGIRWGEPDDLPIPADYDGDGRTDVSVFRPTTNQWFNLNLATGAITVRSFGQTGDVPSPYSVQPR